MQHKWSSSAVTMVTDEVKMRNDTALSSYLLAPTQEKEVVVCCSEESLWGASGDNGSTAGAWWGARVYWHFHGNGDQFTAPLLGLWVYDHFLKCQPERVVEKGESCCRGAERERVHFQSLFVLFSDNLLGAGKSLNRQGGDIRWTGETGRRRRF